MRRAIKQTTKNSIARFFAATLMLVTVFQIAAIASDFLLSEEKPTVARRAATEINLTRAASKNGALEFEIENAKGFYSILNQILIKRGWRKEDLCDEKDAVVARIMREYGSVYVVAEKALPPPVCMFTSAEEVENFQRKAAYSGAEIRGARIELQSAALEALLKARAEALEKGLDITPRDGSEAARRDYADTLRLWKSRFEPACEYWQKQGKLSAGQIEKLKSLPIKEQVREVLQLEKQGIYFNKFFNNSILYSVAAPGTSQHLSMLAFDVNEYDNPEVRAILAKHGWFQTVRNDLPHFTYLGRRQEDLGNLGLKQVATRTGKFWVPNV